MIAVIVLFVVFMLIATRGLWGFRLQIWQIMLFGAVAVLLTLQIGPIDAAIAINLDVMLFLFGMFIVGQALDESGYISALSFRLFKNARTADRLVLLILFSVGIASAVLMNDTIAIIGTPLMLYLARVHRLDPKVLLLALAFAVTIGSTMSPIGNPQNLLIAIGGDVPNPFVTFFAYLAVPTLLNLIIAYFILKWYYNKTLSRTLLELLPSPIKDKRLADLSRASLYLIIILILIKIAFVALDVGIDIRLSYIALIAALPVVLFSPRRVSLIRNIDWHTLIFFAAMFVLMASVWDSRFFQSAIEIANLNVVSLNAVFGISIPLSQFISNVPLAALYLPVLVHAGASTKALIALAAGSTIAGNLTVLGAASNVIIIQNAEKSSEVTLTYLEFAKIGIPLTILNALVYWGFLMVI